MTHDFQFSYDWISGYFQLWEYHIPIAEDLHILEIGCFEGRASVWFLQRFPNCSLTCIDTFKGALDHKQLGLDFSDTERRWRHNTAPWKTQVDMLVGTSMENLWQLEDDRFDILLVDGSHVACDVLWDIVHSWPLLKSGGVLILDDYGWGVDRPAIETPKPAIDAFLACHFGHYVLWEKGYQVIVQKL